MIIIIDTDGLIGSILPEDIHYQKSHTILQYLAENKSKLVYPATVIVESVTLLQGRFNRPELADQILQLTRKNGIDIEPVDSRILQEASLLMDVRRSKHNTLFDAIVAVVAKKYKADAIFSFDNFYKSKGFKLAGELILS